MPINRDDNSVTVIAIASLATTAYNDFALNATGIALISKTGVTHLGVRLAKEISATQPSGLNYVVFASRDAAGGESTAPKLVVTTQSSSSNFALLGVG